MIHPGLQTLAQVSATRLLNTAAEGAAIAALVWVLLRMAGRQNSGTRFAVWFSALLAVAALPFSTQYTSPNLLASARLHAGLVVPGPWALYLFASWVAVSVLLLARLAMGFWRVRTLRRKCVHVDLSTLHPQLTHILWSFDSSRRVSLCVSDDVTSPSAVGFFHPAIVFPAWALRDLSLEELEVVLLHELAHLRRWDDWTNLAQKVVKALFFFHPAVWWIENRLALEREMACDDMVLARTANPKAYAACLIAFAEKVQRGRELALAQAAVSHIRQTSLRISQILDVRRPNATRVWKPVLGVITGLSVAAFIAAPYVPRVIAFQDRAQPAPALASMSSVSAVRSVLASSIGQASMSRRNIRTADPAIEAVPVRFEPRASASSVRGEFITSRKLRPRLAQASGRNQIPAMLVIMQSAQYDASGSAVWTICVWRVRAGSSVQDQIETAIVLSSI